MPSFARGLRSLARPLKSAIDLDPLMERIGDARHVLLGKASHGTSEFYTWRAELTKRLIVEKGFTIVERARSSHGRDPRPPRCSSRRHVQGSRVGAQHPHRGRAAYGHGAARHAGPEWGAPMQRMRVPAARPGSFEAAMSDAGVGDSILIFEDSDDGGVPGLDEPIGHRAIGIVYDPDRERRGNYVPTIVPGRYDAFVHIEESRALDPLHMAVRVDGDAPETFPSGM